MNAKFFVDEIIRRESVVEFCGVSDSTLKEVIREVESRGMYVPFTNEADAVAYAAGRSVRGKVAVLLQNSGLTNASSPISSLTSLYEIPVVFIVGLRGVGAPEDEPQHRIVGPNTLNLIKLISGDRATINNVDSKEIEQLCYCENGTQNYYIVQRSAIDPPASAPTTSYEVVDKRMDRIEIIEEIMRSVKDRDDVVVVSTTGFTSRELMEIDDSPRNFYMLGSMGCLPAFAEGLIKSCPDKKIVILDGDGSFLMHPEGLMHLKEFSKDRYFYILFDNESHLSTGGQKLPSGMINNVKSLLNYDLYGIKGDREVFSILFERWLDSRLSCQTLRIHVSPVTFPELPRPKIKPHKIYTRFKEFINGSNPK